ncbi:amidohydrolase family protein [Aquifex aeolicus]|uniref:Amidohydrolase 3 domain-containing protein n=1 Tax=Aquifex aeolicus (strain VF5) TaxID=224324 RepID=O67410_AQUAE|nr:amidohydrolase family protein [Aquifex aeolicus]AAC07378.1 putative protein [Aquifex aeolicus VF5]
MLVDAHTHLELFAISEVPFHEFKKKEELLKFLKSLKRDYLVAYGLDYGLGITPEDLNTVNFPLLLIYKDGHKGILNKHMKKLLNKEGYFLVEHELWEAANKLKPKGEALRKAIRNALKKAKEMGISEVHDYVDEEVARIYFSEELPINVVLMPYYESLKSVLKLFEQKGESEKLQLGWVKVYLDGSISARTAHLKEPYRDTKTKGKLLISEEKLLKILKELESLNLRASLHAIGDGAIEVAIKAFEKLEPKLKYHRIEHAELISEDQIRRVKELNLLLCMQPNFTCYYREIYLEALGEERTKRINPIDLVDKIGAPLIFGTDMMPFDVNYALNCAKEKLPEEKVLYYFGGWKRDRDYVKLN